MSYGMQFVRSPRPADSEWAIDLSACTNVNCQQCHGAAGHSQGGQGGR